MGRGIRIEPKKLEKYQRMTREHDYNLTCSFCHRAVLLYLSKPAFSLGKYKTLRFRCPVDGALKPEEVIGLEQLIEL